MEEIGSLYRSIVEESDEGILVVQDGEVVYANEAFSSMIAQTQDSITGESVASITAEGGPFDGATDTAETRALPRKTEATVETSSGDRVTVELSLSRITHEGDPAVVARCRDRPAQREQFQNVVEQTGLAVYVTDTDGTIEYANAAFEEITGYSESEAVGQTPRILQSGEHDVAYYEEFWETILDGDSWEGEMTDERADGDRVVLDQVVSPVLDENGDPEKFVAVARDVTESRTHEAELARERDFLQSLIESLPYPFYVVDAADYSIEYANSEARVEAGTSCYEVTHGRDKPCDEGESRVPCPLTAVQDDLEPVTVEHGHVDDEGNERHYQVHASPILDDGGELRQIAESNIDITDRVESERRLEEQRDNLEVLNQVVRHDIRNDLQLVLTYTETLQPYVEPEGEAYIERVLDAAYDAVDITTTARDVTEVMLQSDIDNRPTSLRFTLENQVEAVRSNYDRALVTVDGSIPNVDVSADDMLGSVFRNLLSNAVQHNTSEVPEVTVSATRGDETVRVEIADNGPGIPEDRKESVFEQGEMSLDSEGTGLGLYLVDTLVGRYGGTVHVEDNDPDGAVFVVELPLVDPTPNASGAH